MQTSTFFQRLNNTSLSVCKHVGLPSTDKPRPLKQSQFENGLSRLRGTSWHFLFLSRFIILLHFYLEVQEKGYVEGLQEDITRRKND